MMWSNAHMRVLVTGASGTLGQPLLAALERDGIDAVGLSRTPRPGFRVGVVGTGEGLAEAVRDVDAIVHAASDPRHAKDTDIEGTRKLASFGLPVTYLSIVGVDRSPFRYYRQKLAGEEVLKETTDQWSIIRSTQFHEFIDFLLSASRGVGARLPWRSEQSAAVWFPRDFVLGPVSASEVAGHIAHLIQTGPTRRVHEIGGPERCGSEALALRWAEVRGGRNRWLPTFGRSAAAFKRGVTVPTNPEFAGTITWDEYLADTTRG